MTVNIAGNAPASVINVATVGGGGGETNLTNDTSSEPTGFTGNSPDLLVTTSCVGTPVRGGSGIYQLTFLNDGTAPTTGVVTLTDPLPASLTATGISGPGWTCSLVSVSRIAAQRRTGSRLQLSAGERYGQHRLQCARQYREHRQYSGRRRAHNERRHGAKHCYGGRGPADHHLGQDCGPTTAQLGDVVGYTITINNTNQFPYSNDVVNDVLPAGFAYVPGSGRLVAGAGAAQPIVPVCTSGTIVFNLPTLAALQTDTITYRVQIGGATKIGQNVNTAQFTGLNPGGRTRRQPGRRRGGQHHAGLLYAAAVPCIGRVFVMRTGTALMTKVSVLLRGFAFICRPGNPPARILRGSTTFR